MGKTLGSARQKALIEFLVTKRESKGMTQMQLAQGLGQYQSFVARIESGQRRIDVVEFLEIAEILSFDPCLVLKKIARSI